MVRFILLATPLWRIRNCKLVFDFLSFAKLIERFRIVLVTIGLFQKFFVTPLLRITIFRSHTPWNSIHFSPPPLEFHAIFSRTPLEFHGNPLSSIMTPWNFPILKITSWNFPDFHFQDPLEFPLSSTGGIRKISGKAHCRNGSF